MYDLRDRWYSKDAIMHTRSCKKELEFAGQLNMILYDFIYIISRFILFLEADRKKKSIENCKCRAAVSGK